MRRLIVMSLLVAASACDLGGSTRPDGTFIHVRLVDDVAKSGGRNVVVVTFSSGEQVTARTGTDGKVDIPVAGAGVYRVKVVPRDGFVSSEAHSKTVTVGALETVTVDFTLFRVGSTDLPAERFGR